MKYILAGLVCLVTLASSAQALEATASNDATVLSTIDIKLDAYQTLMQTALSYGRKLVTA
jgi:hypothetical protein